MQAICPKCFEKIGMPAYTCGTPGCARLDMPHPAKNPDSSAPEASPPLCPDCDKPMSARLCPHCGHPLNRGSADMARLPFTLAGASGCGKSNYLSVLIQQIRQDMGKSFGCALYPLGVDSTMDFYDHMYYQPVFVRGICPPSTLQEDIEPLDYSLIFSDKPAKAGKACNLAFYDSCGATFDSEKTVSQFNGAIPLSRGILFMIDPSQFPVVQEALSAQGLPVLTSEPNALLARVIHLIREGGGLASMNQKIPIPIAVCLTKLDTITHLLDPSSFIAHPSRHLREPSLNTAELQICSLEVQSLIESWAGKEFINQIHTQFAHAAFFGLSALGRQPLEGEQIGRVSAHRVLDPFLWLLFQNQIIHGR